MSQLKVAIVGARCISKRRHVHWAVGDQVRRLDFSILVRPAIWSLLSRSVLSRVDVLRVAFYALPWAMLFSPEFVLGTVGSRAISVRLDDLILAFIALGLLFEFGLLWRTLRHSRSMVLAASAFFGIAVIASFWGWINGTTLSPFMSLFYLAKLAEYFVLAFCAIALVQSKGHVKALSVSLLAAVAVLLLWTIFPLFGSDGRRYLSLPFDIGGTQQSSVLGVFLLVMVWAFWLFTDRRSPLFTSGLLMGIVTSGVLIIGSGSRVGIPASLFGLITVASLGIYLRGWRIIAVNAALFLGALSVGLSLGALQWPAGAGRITASVMAVASGDSRIVQPRLTLWTGKRPLSQESEVTSQRRTEGEDQFPQEEVRQWSGVPEAWLSRPVLGHGMPAVKWLDNWYLRLLLETGALGLAAWVWLMIALCKALKIGVQPGTGLTATYCIGAVGILFAMLVASITAEQFMTVRTAMPFWLLVGAGVGVAFGTTDRVRSTGVARLR